MPNLTNRKNLFRSVKSLIQNAQQNVVRNVNSTMLLTYFEIGRMIVEDEQRGKQRAEYSKETLSLLSKFLHKEFGSGYSMTTLEYCRKFYQIYSNRIPQSVIEELPKTNKRLSKPVKSGIAKIPQSVIEEFKTQAVQFPFKLNWTHYIQLLKIKNEDERNFYEIEAIGNNWSVRELQRQYT